MKDGDKTVVIDKDLTKSIVRTAILELDLEMTKAINRTDSNVATVSADLKSFKKETEASFELLKTVIPAIVDEKVKACEKKQRTEKKWNIKTFLVILGIALPTGLSLYSIFGG